MSSRKPHKDAKWINIGGVLSCHCHFRCLRYHVRWIPEAIEFGEVVSTVDYSSKSGEKDKKGISLILCAFLLSFMIISLILHEFVSIFASTRHWRPLWCRKRELVSVAGGTLKIPAFATHSPVFRSSHTRHIHASKYFHEGRPLF
jgi:hypothetical protein